MVIGIKIRPPLVVQRTLNCIQWIPMWRRAIRKQDKKNPTNFGTIDFETSRQKHNQFIMEESNAKSIDIE